MFKVELKISFGGNICSVLAILSLGMRNTVFICYLSFLFTIATLTVDMNYRIEQLTLPVFCLATMNYSSRQP